MRKMAILGLIVVMLAGCGKAATETSCGGDSDCVLEPVACECCAKTAVNKTSQAAYEKTLTTDQAACVTSQACNLACVSKSAKCQSGNCAAVSP